MIHFRKGEAATFIVTLTEKVTLAEPYYLFVFQNYLGEQVSFLLSHTQDESLFMGRYNQFTIAVDDYFPSAAAFLWTYKVYEQASAELLNEQGLKCLESGYMQLSPSIVQSASSFNSETLQIKAFHAE
jgi:hypothetical protein